MAYKRAFHAQGRIQEGAIGAIAPLEPKGGSRSCEHSALCVCYGKSNKSMVPSVSQLLTKIKTFKLNQSLTCADFGIYVATCVICHEQYVGQTSNKFSKRWSAHRSNWNKQNCKTDSDKDQMALSRHYSENPAL